MTEKANKKYIAIFDSGVGGLTVLHHAMQHLPHEHFIYYADSANVPYGNKTPEQVMNLVEKSINELIRYPLKAVVIACNTASSIAVQQLRDQFEIPIIGMEPAVKPALESSDPRMILVMATGLTLSESKYLHLIESLKASSRVETLPMQELVDYAEEYDFESHQLKRFLKSRFSKVHWENYHTVVLGCTHFIYFKPLLLDLVPSHIQFVDGNEGTIRRLASGIQKNRFGTESELLCMLSGMEVSNEVIQPYFKFLKGEHFRHFNLIK